MEVGRAAPIDSSSGNVEIIFLQPFRLLVSLFLCFITLQSNPRMANH